MNGKLLLKRTASAARIATAAMLTLLGSAVVRAGPFSVAAELSGESPSNTALRVSFRVPEHHYLYADRIAAELADGRALIPESPPAPVRKLDPAGVSESVYVADFALRFPIPPDASYPLDVRVSYQGCGENTCFLPEKQNFRLDSPAAGTAIAAQAPPETAAVAPAGTGPRAPAGWRELAGKLTIAGKGLGYLNATDFLAFLDKAQSGGRQPEDKLAAMFGKRGIWTLLALALVILGGAALNLTPCVLPMIPVNIAIIGAGARAGSKRRGFLVGGVYGIAMALAYGAVGLFVVLSGARFGTLNASAVFNAVIALVFIVLALAAFDVFSIDLSRFQTAVQPGKPGSGGTLVTAFVMGAVSALLAGACVAPIVISVLLVSARLCAAGDCVGLLLPFLLGLGMGLPWPFLGAGLSFLPKPGAWMVHVRRLFGVVILGFAAYYGHTAYSLHARYGSESAAGTEGAGRLAADSGWHTSIESGIEAALAERKPMFIDFWASWCKSCLAMDASTLKNPEVLKRLEAFVRVKYQADNLDDPEVREVMERFGVMGLPTYVVATFNPHD